MSGGYYILDGDGEPVPTDLLGWAQWFESHAAERQTACDRLPDGALVSTVFLGVDHRFGEGPPLLFETMTFDRDGASMHCRRYATRADALDGHAALLAELLGFAPTE